jgi:hypothetical protein
MANNNGGWFGGLMGGIGQGFAQAQIQSQEKKYQEKLQNTQRLYTNFSNIVSNADNFTPDALSLAMKGLSAIGQGDNASAKKLSDALQQLGSYDVDMPQAPQLPGMPQPGQQGQQQGQQGQQGQPNILNGEGNVQPNAAAGIGVIGQGYPDTSRGMPAPTQGQTPQQQPQQPPSFGQWVDQRRQQQGLGPMSEMADKIRLSEGGGIINQGQQRIYEAALGRIEGAQQTRDRLAFELQAERAKIGMAEQSRTRMTDEDRETRKKNTKDWKGLGIDPVLISLYIETGQPPDVTQIADAAIRAKELTWTDLTRILPGLERDPESGDITTTYDDAKILYPNVISGFKIIGERSWGGVSEERWDAAIRYQNRRNHMEDADLQIRMSQAELANFQLTNGPISDLLDHVDDLAKGAFATQFLTPQQQMEVRELIWKTEVAPLLGAEGAVPSYQYMRAQVVINPVLTIAAAWRERGRPDPNVTTATGFNKIYRMDSEQTLWNTIPGGDPESTVGTPGSWEKTP